LNSKEHSQLIIKVAKHFYRSFDNSRNFNDVSIDTHWPLICCLPYQLREFGGECMKKTFYNWSAMALTLLIASAHSMADEKTICVGDRVHHAGYGSGRVVEVYSDGTAKINFDDYSGYVTRDTSRLGKSVRCQGEICVGNRIHDTGYGSGRVAEIYADGTAKIDFDDYSGSLFRRTDSLGKGIQCDGKICVGDRVHDSGYGSGKVKEIYTDGKAKIDFDQYSGYVFRRISNLGARINCSNAKNCISKLSELDNLLGPTSNRDERKFADERNGKIQQTSFIEFADAGSAVKASTAAAAN
jgi:hypothetical protein